MDKRRDIGKVVKDRLSNMDKSPTNLSWNQIENQLDENKKERKLFLFKKRSLAALILLLMSSSFIIYEQYFSSDLNKSNYKLENNEITTIKDTLKNIEKTVVQTPYSNSEKANETLNNLHTNSSNKNLEKSVTYNEKNYVVQKKENEKKAIASYDSTSNQSNSTESSLSLLNKIEKTNKEHLKKENYNPLSENKIEVVPQEINSEKAIAESKDTMVYMHQEKQELITMTTKIVPAISVHITPNYTFSKLGNESLINKRFGSNINKNGEVSLSYGASLVFNLNKKTALRVGYDRSSIKFQEKNILSSTVINAASSLGIILSEDVQNKLETSEPSKLTQQISYHKASLGFLYKISNKKITTSIIGDIGFLYQEKKPTHNRNKQ